MKGSDMMYPNYFNRYNPNMKNAYNNGDRFIGGGFLGPFILGGITGGLLAPSFYPRPIYGPVPMPVPVYQTPIYQNQYQVYY